TIWSSVPRTHSTGRCAATFTNSDRSQYTGDRALTTPRVPGAEPGQCELGRLSPGEWSSPPAGKRSGGRTYSERSTERGETGLSSLRSPAAIRLTISGLTTPAPLPAP